MSEIKLDSAATGTTRPDAESGEADEVSDYSEEADGLDAAGSSDDLAAPSAGDADSSADLSAADGADSSADSALEEFMRDLRQAMVYYRSLFDELLDLSKSATGGVLHERAS